jgi:hypothetical protein
MCKTQKRRTPRMQNIANCSEHCRGRTVESTTRKQSSRMKRGRKNLELVGMGQMGKRK